MLSLQIWMREDRIEWVLRKMRIGAAVRALGIFAWERRGFVVLDEQPLSDRQALSVALKAIQDRLGER